MHETTVLRRGIPANGKPTLVQLRRAPESSEALLLPSGSLAGQAISSGARVPASLCARSVVAGILLLHIRLESPLKAPSITPHFALKRLSVSKRSVPEPSRRKSGPPAVVAVGRCRSEISKREHQVPPSPLSRCRCRCGETRYWLMFGMSITVSSTLTSRRRTSRFRLVLFSTTFPLEFHRFCCCFPHRPLHLGVLL